MYTAVWNYIRMPPSPISDPLQPLLPFTYICEVSWGKNKSPDPTSTASKKYLICKINKIIDGITVYNTSTGANDSEPTQKKHRTLLDRIAVSADKVRILVTRLLTAGLPPSVLRNTELLNLSRRLFNQD
ncbi:hypothetical protein GN958_ATG12140 [Phytophthora infestans]|uniref:Uncharacterized protein n=1 Tax=Phytophthora infestans TaxID=4787 RepID=A0A8S9UC07_PHYIN|nr:hypothetical protein GN958_ATG14330 [Phytophthora infestans]KAF4138635.1 hypothetical protein GN958_ATG12140 [Phytophthora infestans]